MRFSTWLKFKVKTLDAVALKDAACKLAQLAQEFQPNIIIGIRSGGYHVASLITEQFSGTPIFSITCRRPVTAPKTKNFRQFLKKLPYFITNSLRICEHILLTQLAGPSSLTDMALDESELAPLRAYLSALGDTARILIVDDAVDRGVTMSFVHKAINTIANPGARIKMAAITVTTATPLVEPDFLLYRYAICRFPGHSTPAAEVLFIFDLDGTLLSVNSYPLWVRYMLFGKFHGLSPHGRIILSLKAAVILAKRKLFKESHFASKQRFQALWAAAIKRDRDQFALHNFCKQLSGFVRPNLAEVLTLAKQKNLPTVLATAAAGEYAIAFGNMLGFNHMVTTPVFTGEKTEENIREKKCERVMALLTLIGHTHHKRVFFTDHEEDFPLIKESYVTFWLGDDAELPRLQKEVPAGKIIPCHKLTGDKIKGIV